MYLLIVTGMSGAGKSTALNALEELGYYCVDNLPSSMLPAFVEMCDGASPPSSGLRSPWTAGKACCLPGRRMPF